ncbi:hypothetical protein ACM913_001529 [Cronobacter sakazakii]
MSEISKEHDGKLRELRDELKIWQGYYDPVDDKEQHEMFALAADAIAELLALRERAEPVGFVGRHKETGKFASWLYPEAPWLTDDKYEVLSAYITPPAPVVSDGLKRAVEFYEQVKRENAPAETGAWKDAVNWVLDEACRAAMPSAAPATN